MRLIKLITVTSKYILFPFLALTITACSDNDGQTADVNPTPNTNSIEASAHPAAKNPLAKNGTVKTIKNAGGYSYIEVDIKGETFWLATGITNFKPGEEIAWNDYAVMNNFNSKALNRVFDQILFVDRVLPVAALSSTQHQDIVLESMDSAGYSYIQVEEKGKQPVWLAAPSTSLVIGQTISWDSGAAMRNFSSKTLNRTFDEIFFVNSVNI